MLGVWATEKQVTLNLLDQEKILLSGISANKNPNVGLERQLSG